MNHGKPPKSKSNVTRARILGVVWPKPTRHAPKAKTVPKTGKIEELWLLSFFLFFFLCMLGRIRVIHKFKVVIMTATTPNPTAIDLSGECHGDSKDKVTTINGRSAMTTPKLLRA